MWIAAHTHTSIAIEKQSADRSMVVSAHEGQHYSARLNFLFRQSFRGRCVKADIRFPECEDKSVTSEKSSSDCENYR